MMSLLSLTLSKILSVIGKKKRIARKKNRWKRKQNRLIPSPGGEGNVKLPYNGLRSAHTKYYIEPV